MACIMEPKVGSNGELLKWDPTQIPSTKPFINIVTSATEPMSSFDNVNFVKTKSLIYSPFHKESRNVNFEIGYSKESTWLEYLNSKWMEYSNFFIGGFFEAVYVSKEKGLDTTYAQIDAKLIDYDVRFRVSNSTTQSNPSVTSSDNVFARKRNISSTPTSSPKLSKPIAVGNS